MSLAPLYSDHESSADALLEQLPRYGVDAVAAKDFGNERLSDEAQLAFATGLGRAVYTANAPDFSRLYTEWMRAGRHHAGIIIRTEQRNPIGAQIRALLRVLEEYESTGLSDRLLWV